MCSSLFRGGIHVKWALTDNDLLDLPPHNVRIGLVAHGDHNATLHALMQHDLALARLLLLAVVHHHWYVP